MGAVANTDDVSDWEGAARLVAQASTSSVGLDVLINNAGILPPDVGEPLRGRVDVVMRVHAKGTSRRCATPLPTGAPVPSGEKSASVVNTSSPSGLFANVGQSNYARRRQPLPA